MNISRDSHQRRIDLADRLETIRAVKEGLVSIENRQGTPMDDVFDALEKELLSKSPNR